MPYIVLKKKKLVPGQEDVMVVPDVWVEDTLEDENAFVCLPVADCNTIKTYLVEQIAPLPGWEKHECAVMCRNIPNLISAYTTIEKIQNEASLEDFVELFNPPIPKKRLKRDEPKNKKVLEKIVVEEDEQKIFPLFRADQENEDPFGDIIPPLEMPLLTDTDVPDEEKNVAVNIPENMDTHTFSPKKLENDPLGGNVSVTSQSKIFAETNSYRSSSLNKKAFTVADNYDSTSDDDAPSDYDAPSDGYAPSNGDTQSWSSRKKSQPIFDKTEDAKKIAQLYDLINELKSMMISNQEEIKQNIRESFDQMQATMVSLIKQNMMQYSQTSISKKPSGTTQHETSSTGLNVFEFKKLMNLEDVIRFNYQLINSAYRRQFYHMINVALKNETNSQTRLRIALFMIFDRKLFNEFSWDGENGKNALKKYENITKVLEYSGTTPTRRISLANVGQFIQNMNKNVPSSQINPSTVQASIAQSSKVQPSIAQSAIIQTSKPKSSITIKHKVGDPTLVKEAVSLLEQRGIMCKTIPVPVPSPSETRTELGKIIQVEKRGIICKPVSVPNSSVARTEPGQTIQAKSTTEDAQTVSEAVQLLKTPANTLTNKSKIITNAIVLHNFEKRLNDTNMKGQVLAWIDKILGNEPYVEKRLLKLFNRLIDIKVLQNFDWTNGKGSYPPLSGYTNFIQLFVYASNVKKESEPTPTIKNIVTNFFIKQLTHAESCTQETNLQGPSTSVCTM